MNPQASRSRGRQGGSGKAPPTPTYAASGESFSGVQPPDLLPRAGRRPTRLAPESATHFSVLLHRAPWATHHRPPGRATQHTVVTMLR